MVEAIAQSCDVYFYDLALRGGVDSIADMARRLGFGETFDLGLPGARPGLVPTEAWKRATPGRPWQKGETVIRSEEHTSELQSLMRISYAVFCLKKNTQRMHNNIKRIHHTSSQ